MRIFNDETGVWAPDPNEVLRIQEKANQRQKAGQNSPHSDESANC